MAESNPLDLSHYDYELPRGLIAQRPLKNRTDARLLLVNRQQESIQHFHVRDLPELLTEKDLVIVNDTRVLPAKLVGYRKSTGGRWQGLFLEADEQGHLMVLAKTRGNIKPGEKIVLQDRQGADRVEATAVIRLEQGAWMIYPETDLSTTELFDTIGRVPLPHYIRDGNMVESDLQDYQTVFAKTPGAVAAPTAGLHLTEQLIEDMQAKGIGFETVTLHVGIGTFRPIKTDRVDEHHMHQEWGSIRPELVDRINQTRANGGRVIAVGTTSVRVLETAGRSGKAEAWEGQTDLFIFPGFQFNVIQGLMTNFHFPKTSLLVMIRTFGGDELIRRAYRQAIEQEYRFYSYGDAMLIV